MSEAAQEPSRVTVVTAENYDQYVNQQLGVDPEKQAADEAARLEALKQAEAELAKKEEDDPTSTLDEHKEVPQEKRNKLQERFSKLTSDRKAAEERAAQAVAEAEQLRKEAEEARRLAEELKSKYEPVKTELDPEPKPEQFTDINEYSKALKEWAAEKAVFEAKANEAKARQEAAQKALIENWQKRQAEAKSELIDYDAVINGAADVGVSDQVRDAILDSEVGPHLLYHLAKNPDIAKKINEMSAPKAIKEIGKLELELSNKKQTAQTPIAEISKAPAPITPIKGASASVGSLSGHEAVPDSMTYDDWKAARKAGRIR